jgi:hypothetical protein
MSKLLVVAAAAALVLEACGRRNDSIHREMKSKDADSGIQSSSHPVYHLLSHLVSSQKHLPNLQSNRQGRLHQVSLGTRLHPQTYCQA